MSHIYPQNWPFSVDRPHSPPQTAFRSNQPTVLENSLFWSETCQNDDSSALCQRDPSLISCRLWPVAYYCIGSGPSISKENRRIPNFRRKTLPSTNISRIETCGFHRYTPLFKRQGLSICRNYSQIVTCHERITNLGVLSGRQNLVAFLTFQAHCMPVFAQRRLLLGYIQYTNTS